uniref:Uncharacterized protein n=1 Tax=Oryza brachyantha TaxID=4533 RepID=J3MW26_ORYBR
MVSYLSSAISANYTWVLIKEALDRAWELYVTKGGKRDAKRSGIRKTVGDDLARHRHLRRDTRSDQYDAYKKQVVLNGLCEKHHMEKLRTVFREERDDDVTKPTIDITIAYIKIKMIKCWNPKDRATPCTSAASFHEVDNI